MLKDLFLKTGEFNLESKIYKLANNILYEKYAIFCPGDALKFYSYNCPDAEYLAIIEADKIISKENKEPRLNKRELKKIMEDRLILVSKMNKIRKNNNYICEVDGYGIARLKNM